MKSKKISLESKLNKIYEKYDLRTTCEHRTDCCKTSMPSMLYSEFSSLINKIWSTRSDETKIELIVKSIEYFFHYQFEKFGMETLVKPCMFLNEEKKICSCYKNRPLNCRLYGLWPKDVYNARVDKFEKAYEGLVKREDLPLNTQCPNVKRTCGEELKIEEINDLFEQLDQLDFKVGNFSELQIKNKENYRTFHDWLLLKIFGDQWLSLLTTFMITATKEAIDDQMKQIIIAVKENFSKNMPKI